VFLSFGKEHHDLALFQHATGEPPAKTQPGSTTWRGGLDNFEELRAAYKKLEADGVPLDGTVEHNVMRSIKLDRRLPRIEEANAARDVVLDGAVERDPHPLQLFVGGPQLLEVVEPHAHVVEARLVSRAARGGLLEERQVVVLLAEAEEHGATLQVLVGHLQAQALRVTNPAILGVPDRQYDVTEPLRWIMVSSRHL